MRLLKYDILAILLSVLVFSFFTFFGWNKNGESALLLIEDASGSALYPLSENRIVTVLGPVGESVIKIDDGKAAFTHSDCTNNLCIQMGSIDKSGEWAACLPNEIFITITGKGEDEVDSVVF